MNPILSGRIDIEIKKISINMVRNQDVKDRMVELASFQYCEDKGISIADLGSDKSYSDLVPGNVLDQISKGLGKPSFDKSKVRRLPGDLLLTSLDALSG